MKTPPEPGLDTVNRADRALPADAPFRRTRETIGGIEVLRDRHARWRGEVSFAAGGPGATLDPVLLEAPSGVLERHRIEGIGTVVHADEGGSPVTLWIPRDPREQVHDEHGRLRDGGGRRVVPYVRLEDPHRRYLGELVHLSPAERTTYRRSVWFTASSPGSLWDYLILGSLYDPRPSRTNQARFRCQQCAFAWWNYLELLRGNTGKELYGLLRDEVAYSVLLDQEDSGAWRHGFWSDRMETHVRFHLDGVDLLLAQHERTGEAHWLDAARRGLSFVLDHVTDRLADGSLWVLHDTLEYEQNHRFESKVLGKHPRNALVLNTHLQALRVLFRMTEREEGDREGRYAAAYRSGMEALRQVLALRPAGGVHRPLMWWILGDRYLGNRRHSPERVLRKLVRPARSPVYWKLQERFPRLVHANGFIERDLSLSCASDGYHVSNTKDLLRLYELDPVPWLAGPIRKGVDYLRKYVERHGIQHLVRERPQFIETVDVMLLYSRLFEPLPGAYLEELEEAGREAADADSLEGVIARGGSGKA